MQILAAVCNLPPSMECKCVACFFLSHVKSGFLLNYYSADAFNQSDLQMRNAQVILMQKCKTLKNNKFGQKRKGTPINIAKCCRLILSYWQNSNLIIHCPFKALQQREIYTIITVIVWILLWVNIHNCWHCCLLLNCL